MAGRPLLDIDIQRDGETAEYVATVVTPGKRVAGKHRFRLPDLESRLGSIAGLALQRARESSTQAREAHGRLSVDGDELRLVGDTLTSPALDLRDVGRELASTFIDNGVREALRDLEHERGLWIRLRLADDPRLLRIPWEFLYDDRIHFLAKSWPLVRYLDTKARTLPIDDPPLRILIVTAQSRHARWLDVDRERKAIEAQLAALGEHVESHWTRGTYDAIETALEEHRPHVLHFIGHGSMNGDHGALVLEADGSGDDHPSLLSHEDLTPLLTQSPDLRLVYLNACHGGAAPRMDTYAGLAQAAAGVGVPAVVAMQFAISDDAAILIANRFYGAVARGDPVDVALRKAKVHPSLKGEWATPVLYLAAEDSPLLAPETVERQTPSPSTAWIAATHASLARLRFILGEASLAIVLVDRLDERLKTHLDVAGRLQRARAAAQALVAAVPVRDQALVLKVRDRFQRIGVALDAMTLPGDQGARIVAARADCQEVEEMLRALAPTDESIALAWQVVAAWSRIRDLAIVAGAVPEPGDDILCICRRILATRPTLDEAWESESSYDDVGQHTEHALEAVDALVASEGDDRAEWAVLAGEAAKVIHEVMNLIKSRERTVLRAA